MGKSRKTSTPEWRASGCIGNIKCFIILLKYPLNHFYHLHIYSIFSLFSQISFPSYGFMFILIFWFKKKKYIYIYIYIYIFHFFPSPSQLQIWVGPFFFFPYLISVPFSLAFIENHTSFPLTFSIVTHLWNLIYDGVL